MMESKSPLSCTRRRFIGAAAAWSLGALPGACAPVDPAAGPLYAALPPPGAGGAAYRLAIARFNPADDARYRKAMQALIGEYRGKVGGLP